MSLNIAASAKKTIPIVVLLPSACERWLKEQSKHVQDWAKHLGFSKNSQKPLLVPSVDGQLSQVVMVIPEGQQALFGQLPLLLPYQHVYELVLPDVFSLVEAGLKWCLGSYAYLRYRKEKRTYPKLLLQDGKMRKCVKAQYAALAWGRDLVNTPAEDLGPDELAYEVEQLAQQYSASFKKITGKKRLAEKYPAIYAVGRASDREPCLAQLDWQAKNSALPHVVLVGKGVCFDTGGLDLKPSSGMRYMKKDMGGAAHVLALAQLIMASQLPVRLTVLIPAVDNAVSGNAYRPGDVIKTRKGTTVEITNTDAEGRVILADALSVAHDLKPDLVIDFATLTGAARVALGMDVPVYFTNDADIESALFLTGRTLPDPVWPLPLFDGYRDKLKSAVAEMTNCVLEPYGGAITAALFLEHFVQDVPWVHFDVAAWNTKSTPSHPEGGEIRGVRAVYRFLSKRYGKHVEK